MKAQSHATVPTHTITDSQHSPLPPNTTDTSLTSWPETVFSSSHFIHLPHTKWTHKYIRDSSYPTHRLPCFLLITLTTTDTATDSFGVPTFFSVLVFSLCSLIYPTTTDTAAARLIPIGFFFLFILCSRTFFGPFHSRFSFARRAHAYTRHLSTMLPYISTVVVREDFKYYLCLQLKQISKR